MLDLLSIYKDWKWKSYLLLDRLCVQWMKLFGFDDFLALVGISSLMRNFIIFEIGGLILVIIVMRSCWFVIDGFSLKRPVYLIQLVFIKLTSDLQDFLLSVELFLDGSKVRNFTVRFQNIMGG